MAFSVACYTGKFSLVHLKKVTSPRQIWNLLFPFKLRKHEKKKQYFSENNSYWNKLFMKRICDSVFHKWPKQHKNQFRWKIHLRRSTKRLTNFRWLLQLNNTVASLRHGWHLRQVSKILILILMYQDVGFSVLPTIWMSLNLSEAIKWKIPSEKNGAKTSHEIL